MPRVKKIADNPISRRPTKGAANSPGLRAPRSRRARARAHVAPLCCFLLIALVGAPEARAAPRACETPEVAVPAPEDAKNLIELQANRARPTFDIRLRDRRSAEDEITFPPQRGRRLGTDPEAVSAEVLDRPRSTSGRLEGTVRVAARPSKSGRVVVVEACVDDVPRFTAGRYEGNLSVFGPNVADFSYALVVTRKWPWWSAIAVLAVSLAVFLFIAWASGSLTFRLPGGKGRQAVATGVGVLAASGLSLLTYWGTYAKNETWGDDPQAQVTALFIAGFTAATGGLAAAHRAFREGGKAPDDAEPGRAGPGAAGREGRTRTGGGRGGGADNA